MSLDDVKKSLGTDFEKIISEFLKNGIIYEYQFQSLYSLFCKNHSRDLIELLTKETNLPAWYGYAVPYFYYYDSSRFDRFEAEERAIEYQTRKGNMY